MSVMNRMLPGSAEVSAPGTSREFTLKLTAFDQRHYRKLNAARAETIRGVVGKLKREFPLANALDAGCGVGFFSKTLKECGLNVCGFDGREENIVEARRKFPHLPIECGDKSGAEKHQERAVRGRAKRGPVHSFTPAVLPTFKKERVLLFFLRGRRRWQTFESGENADFFHHREGVCGTHRRYPAQCVEKLDASAS
jgi:hypothetical protein